VRRERDQSGQATIMIVGFAFVLAMAVALVVDASAAYLQRQGLDTVADGAALRGADLGATGREVYTGGVPTDRLDLTAAAVRASVHEYLASSGAYATYPASPSPSRSTGRRPASPCRSGRRSTCR
jgi:uncharacterized membrane protein